MDYKLSDALQDIPHLLKDLFRGQHLGRTPKEGYFETTLQWHEQFFLQTVSLAQLPLDAITLDCTLEETLGDRDHDADSGLLAWHEDCTEWESRYRLMPATEQILEHLAAA